MWVKETQRHTLEDTTALPSEERLNRQSWKICVPADHVGRQKLELLVGRKLVNFPESNFTMSVKI